MLDESDEHGVVDVGHCVPLIEILVPSPNPNVSVPIRFDRQPI